MNSEEQLLTEIRDEIRASRKDVKELTKAINRLVDSMEVAL